MDSKNENNKAESGFNYKEYLKAIGPYLLSILVLIVVIAIYFSLSSEMGAINNYLVSHHALKTNSSTVINTTSTNSSGVLSDPNFNITSKLITPSLSLPNDPIITVNGSFGSRLMNLNKPLNATDLAIFNDGNNSYFETAGKMILNGSFGEYIFGSAKGSNKEVYTLTNPLTINGKQSVIYLGSITCIYCGENRWAMALALGKFGNFSRLYTGYSSFGDDDIPTIYWAPSYYNQSYEDLGNFYSSKYINFISIEETDPITKGFDLNSPASVGSVINSTNNTAYEDAYKLVLDLNNFDGTPYTIWGKYNVVGADAADFGFGKSSGSKPPMTYMTHKMVYENLSNPTDSEFGMLDYGAADLYIAMTCASLNNTAPVCTQIPVIQSLETYEGYN